MRFANTLECDIVRVSEKQPCVLADSNISPVRSSETVENQIGKSNLLKNQITLRISCRSKTNRMADIQYGIY